MTNNEKMIELYDMADGICDDCDHLENKNKCSVGGVKVNKWAAACGKFETREGNQSHV